MTIPDQNIKPPAVAATPSNTSATPAQPSTVTTNLNTGVTTTIQGHAVTQSKMIGKYKVEVIRDKCISAASCVAIAPKVFQLDEEGIAIVLSQDGEDDDTKLLAAQSCPTAAIIVTNVETGEQVWPLG